MDEGVSFLVPQFGNLRELGQYCLLIGVRRSIPVLQPVEVPNRTQHGP